MTDTTASVFRDGWGSGGGTGHLLGHRDVQRASLEQGFEHGRSFELEQEPWI